MALNQRPRALLLVAKNAGRPIGQPVRFRSTSLVHYFGRNIATIRRADPEMISDLLKFISGREQVTANAGRDGAPLLRRFQ